MRQKLPPSCRLLQQFFEPSGICAKLQMKRMKTSERKQTQSSFIFHLFFLCSFLCFSCSTISNDYDFKSSDEALDCYRAEREKIHSLGECNASQLLAVVNEWKEISDTVYHYIERDPAFKAHVGLSLDFMEITDSIKIGLEKLGNKDTWTMKDMALLKFSGQDARENPDLKAIIKKAETFYEAIDKVDCSTSENEKVRLRQYETFLEHYAKYEFVSAEDMKTFIRLENTYFQWFLQALPVLNDMDLSPIAKMTESICRNIFKAASENHIEDREALVYMSMRTNRRVISNARVCANYITKGRVKDESQANAYLWMVVQPYLSIDSFSASVLTAKEKEYLFSLAEYYPRLALMLHKSKLADREITDLLPSRMVRLYIATL